ncbi:hypothetical protein KI387_022727, partial [Taxus chinensis]
MVDPSIISGMVGYAIQVLCFLYLSAFLEDEVIFTGYVSQLWIGEGFVTGQDPLQTEQRFVNLLADRCLIKPLLKDSDGK